MEVIGGLSKPPLQRGSGGQGSGGRRGRSCKAGLCVSSAATVRTASCTAPPGEPRGACCHSSLSSAVRCPTAVSTVPGRGSSPPAAPILTRGVGTELGCCRMGASTATRVRIARFLSVRWLPGLDTPLPARASPRFEAGRTLFCDLGKMELAARWIQ